MRTTAHRPTSWLAAALAVAIVFVAVPALEAGQPHGAQYCPATSSSIFWFVQTSDTHIGASGSADANNLRWLVTTAKTVINPSFIVVTGDLTDSTNGNIFGYPNGPYQAEWTEYKGIVDAAGMSAALYYDIPGNHDAYNDRYFAYYLANSVQGRATGRLQASWTRSFTFGSYHFLGVNSADNTGASFKISFPYGDHAGLDGTELAFIESELAAHLDAHLTFVFGHHPVTDTGVSGDTWLFYGQQQFITDLDTSASSAYGYGHTHAVDEAQFKGNAYTGLMNGDGIQYLNIASLGKSSSGQYRVFAVDCDGVSSVAANVSSWPVVLLTSPVSNRVGLDVNPYAYTVPNANNNTVRALVFDAVASPAVTFRIDGSATWLPMSRVSAGSPVWSGAWDASGLTAGQHTIEVRAIGTTTRSDTITVDVTGAPPANRAPVAVNDSYTATSGTPLNVAAPGVLGNDSDPDGDALTAAVAAAPTHGSVILNTNGSFTYTPASGYTGADGFTYTVADGKGGTSNAATVSITVNPAPAADTVTITSATYSSRKRTLSVTATSSRQPNVTLTLVGYGVMKYSSRLRSYSLSVTVASRPASVTVTSSGGGTATSAVQ